MFGVEIAALEPDKIKTLENAARNDKIICVFANDFSTPDFLADEAKQSPSMILGLNLAGRSPRFVMEILLYW